MPHRPSVSHGSKLLRFANRYLDFILLSILVAVGGWLHYLTYLTWPDVLIDSGRDVYIAWRISQGEVLYKNIAYYNGPVAMYLNALIFSVWDSTLKTLFHANTIVLSLIALLLYKLMRRISGVLSAFLGVLVFLLIFPFGMQTNAGAFNYLSPYSHCLTHGLFFGLLFLESMLVAMEKKSDKKAQRAFWLIVSGLAFGASLLTTLELSMAVILPLICLLTLSLVARVRTKSSSFGGWTRLSLVDWAYFALAGVAPIIGALGYFSGHLGFVPAVEAIFYTLFAFFRMDVSGHAFYRNCLGLDNVAGSLSAIVFAFVNYAFVIGFGYLVALLLKHFRVGRRSGSVVAFLISFLLMSLCIFAFFPAMPWYNLARGFSLVAIASALFLLIKDPTQIGAILFALFAFGISLKMGINFRLYQLGFVLGAPGTMVFVSILLGTLPKYAMPRDLRRDFFCATMAAALVAFALYNLGASLRLNTHKIYPVGADRNLFMADWRGAYVQSILPFLREKVPQNATVAAVPEGVMINFLSGHRNPTRHINFMMTEIGIFGEDDMVRGFSDNPPDFILLVHKDTSDFGFRFFGRDYGHNLYSWIRSRYQSIGILGKQPLVDDNFGIEVLQRNF